jgi:hypothetical protein
MTPDSSRKQFDPHAQPPEGPGASPGSSCHVLLVEDRSESERFSRDASGLRVLPVPDSPAHLFAGTAAAPRFALLDEADGAAALPLFALPLFEVVGGARGERLLMAVSPDASLRLNGLPVPPVLLLTPGDQLAPDADLVLHVSRVQRTAPVPPPPELVGQSCEICRVAFTPETRVVLCATCGDARHLEGAEISAEDRLACAELGPCPVCRTELPTSDGFAYWPEV